MIDALGKVVGGLKAIVNLPGAERETIHRIPNDILPLTADDNFLREAARLQN